MQAYSKAEKRLNRKALELVKAGRSTTGEIYYGAGVVLILHINVALGRLVDLHKRAIGERASSAHIRNLPDWGAKILHRRETLSTLGTLVGVGPENRRSLIRSILEFAQRQRSLEGIESVVFSASIGAEREHLALATDFQRTIRKSGAPRFMGGGYGNSPIVDPIAKQMTFLGSQGVGQLAGGTPPSTSGIGRPDPGGNVSENTDPCVKVATVVSALLGLGGGAALGAIAGASVSGKDTSFVILGLGGGGITGFFGGAQGGQSFGQAVCPNASSGTVTPVSSTPSTGGDPSLLSQDQWEQNLVSSTPDSTPSPGEQGDYSSGFAAGWAAASSGNAPGAPTGSDSFGSGFADGYGAAQAMQTLPQGGGTAGGGTTGGDTGGTAGGGTTGGDTGGTAGGGTTGGGTGGTAGGGTTGGDTGGTTGGGTTAGGIASGDDPEGGVGDGPVSPGTGAIFHHYSPSGPGVSGLSSDDDDDGKPSSIKGFGTRVINLADTIPDPENNPHARNTLRQATFAQGSLLGAAIAERLSALADQ